MRWCSLRWPRLDGGASFELALDLRRDAALLAGGVDLELVIGRGVVAAIAGVGDAAIEDVADERLPWREKSSAKCAMVLLNWPPPDQLWIGRSSCNVGDAPR
jgi:hypothetical protein